LAASFKKLYRCGDLVVFKKRWNDGLHDDFDHLNEFEFKLGCFGGDGGGSSGGGGGYSGYSGDDVEASYGTSDAGIGGYEGGGGGSADDAVSSALSDALSNDIGDYSANDATNDMAATGGFGGSSPVDTPAVNQQVQDMVNQAVFSSGYFGPNTQAPVAGLSLADIAPNAVVGSAPTSAPTSYGTPASYGPNAGVPAGYSAGVPSMGLGIGVNAPVSDTFSGNTSTGTPTSTADVMAAALGLDNTIAGFNVGPGMVGNAPGLIGTTKFREGGAVEYPGYGEGMSGGGGIMSVLEPFGNYLTEQIDTQRVDPFLETVSNAAYQEFGIKPSQGGGGGGFFSGDFYKTNLGGDFSGMPPPLPAVQQPGMNTEPSGPVAGISNFGPDVGNGGLFGGGPMSGGTPMQLPGPRIPTYTKGFEDPITPGGPTVGMGYDGEFSGPPMQLPYDPTPMNPLIYDSLAAAGGLPDFAGSAQSYFNPGMGGQREFGPMALSPDRLVQMAQGRLAQRDVKPPEIQAYLNHIVQTGGNPTMMAPPPQSNSLALGSPGLMSASPGGLQLARTQFG
jgi:hypothetical protein